MQPADTTRQPRGLYGLPARLRRAQPRIAHVGRRIRAGLPAAMRDPGEPRSAPPSSRRELASRDRARPTPRNRRPSRSTTPGPTSASASKWRMPATFARRPRRRRRRPRPAPPRRQRDDAAAGARRRPPAPPDDYAALRASAAAPDSRLLRPMLHPACAAIASRRNTRLTSRQPARPRPESAPSPPRPPRASARSRAGRSPWSRSVIEQPELAPLAALVAPVALRPGLDQRIRQGGLQRRPVIGAVQPVDPPARRPPRRPAPARACSRRSSTSPANVQRSAGSSASRRRSARARKPDAVLVGRDADVGGSIAAQSPPASRRACRRARRSAARAARARSMPRT